MHTQSPNATSCKLCGNDLTKPLGGHGAAPARREAPARARATPERPQWRRHVLVRVGAPPVELKPGERLLVGRASEAGLSIPSPRVSREHAEVVWREDRPVLRDLGSQNGTSVGGARITEHALEDGDEVAIGPYSCVYRCLSGYGSVGKMGLVDTALQTQPLVGDDLAGQLDQTSLFEVLQMLEVSQKTGQVVVTSDGRSGRVVLDEGRLVHASAGDLQGARAIHELLGRTAGLFRFSSTVEDDPAQNLPGNVTALMYEAARRETGEAGSA
jgi:pSer/pThr/pTyr-binding forkhead associated (FHA) protein